VRLVEPLGLLDGDAAREAVAAGLAMALAGGPAAFSLVRLLGEPGQPILPPADVPDSWRPSLRRVAAPPSSAGLPDGPPVMGILNLTPDSFSDGGRHLRPQQAIAAGLAMAQAGAAILDLGAESTRPGADPVAPACEQDRLLPVIAGLSGCGALLSVDTRNASTMRAALDAGAHLINDVSALAHDPEAAGLLAGRDCPVILMHMRGTPRTMAGHARYGDVAAEVTVELAHALARAQAAGIAAERLLVDPGIGFAKDPAQNFELLRRLPVLANLGCRIVLGASRKRFIEAAFGTGLAAAARDPGTLASLAPAIHLPGCILRVHDVAGCVQAVRVWQRVWHGGAGSTKALAAT